jgi:hypothetical protein
MGLTNVGIDDRTNLAGHRPVTGPNADNRRVNHLHGGVMDVRHHICVTESGAQAAHRNAVLRALQHAL